MTQADFSIAANLTGTNFRTAVTASGGAMASHHRGASAPAYAVPGLIWIDDSGSPVWDFKAYDGTDWTSIGTLNITTNFWAPANSVLVNGSNLYIADTGTVNAIVAGFSPAIAGYSNGLVIRVKVLNSITGATTINVNGLGAIAIKKGGTNALATGDILAGQIIVLAYDGTNFQLISSVFNVPATVAEVKTRTDNTKPVTPFSLAAIWAKGTDIASASTLTVPTTGGGYFVVTGTTNITAITEAVSAAGRRVTFRFSGVLTLTHDATALILPGAVNITTAAGDIAEFLTEDGTNWRCIGYTQAAGFSAEATGVIKIYAGNSPPINNLFCDGSAYSRTTYARLFAICGINFGAGDGSTTFNVPDLRGSLPLGLDNMGGSAASRVTATSLGGANATTLGGRGGEQATTLTTPVIPSHNHTATVTYSSGTSASGGGGIAHSGGGGTGANITSTIGNTGGGGAHNNMPPWLGVNYIIKT